MTFRRIRRVITRIWETLMLIQVLSLALLACSEQWYSEADHYWPLNELGYGHVYDYGNTPSNDERWHGTVTGEAEVTWSPPRLALSLNRKDALVELGTRHNACYIEVHHCNSSGFTLATWVKFGDANTAKIGLFLFGGGDCGLIVSRTIDGEINCTMKSSELNKTWSLQTLKKRLAKGIWHHLAFTWDNSTETFFIYVNGTRLENVRTEVTSNSTCPGGYCTCDWSMKVGKQPPLNGSDPAHLTLELAQLALWSKVMSNKTILEASSDIRGLFTSNRGCYSSWLAHLQFCYHIQPVWEQTWDDAKLTCERYLGSLVSVGSQEEFDFLEHALYKAKVSTCIHIGLQSTKSNWPPSWIDGNVWRFTKLNSSSNENRTRFCAQRQLDGLWYMHSCSEKCGFVCKKYRAGIFRNAEFECRVRKRDHKLVGYRVAIRLVENELACAIDCLIYGWGCKSYNYQRDYHVTGQHICELNFSNQENNPESLVPRRGYEYCERVA